MTLIDISTPFIIIAICLLAYGFVTGDGTYLVFTNFILAVGLSLQTVHFFIAGSIVWTVVMGIVAAGNAAIVFKWASQKLRNQDEGQTV